MHTPVRTSRTNPIPNLNPQKSPKLNMAALGVSPIHLDALPLLPITTNRRLTRRPSLSNAVRFLRRATARRMTQPSLAVREAAAEQLEDRQSDWANSRPVLLLDVLWNLSFVAVAVGVLSVSLEENPSVPLRVWIVGYALQCVVHVASIGFEYWKRRNGGGALNSDSYDDERSSISKHMESANTMFSFIWWIIGFYWVSAGGETLTRDAPQLYWLSIVFLAFDVFFVVFCVALACLIGFAVCCCLPCIIAILYAVADQEGASDEDINQLPKYKFHKTGNPEKMPTELSGPCGGIMRECNSDQPIEHALTAENAECCICISAYEDGVELRELPCGHHFHCACIDKWLYINATCPLCKFNIVKHSHDGSEEV